MSAGTPIRTVRIPDAIWARALERAQREGVTLSALMQATIREYADGAPMAPRGAGNGAPSDQTAPHDTQPPQPGNVP